MQRQHSLIGLLAIGLLIHTANADISLTLRNANSARGSGPAYLPPPVQDVPISDDYYNGAQQHHHHQQQQQQQSTFKESNFGDSKYHIFEVHNHFEPGSAPQQHATSQARFAAPAYLPPPAREIHIQHVNAPAGVNDELDVSLLSFAAAGVGNVAHGQQQQITIASSVANPFPSNYNHDLSPQQNARRSKLLGESVHKSNAPSNQVTQHIHVENYHVAQQQNHVTAGVSDARQSNFKAAEYLPPAAAAIQQQHQQQQQDEQLASGVQQPFKGPDYLPPPQQQLASVAPQQFKGPDYLPPQSASLTHNQASSQGQVQSYGSQARQLHPTATPEVYQAPGFLPPQGGQQQAQLVGGQVDAQHQHQQQQQQQYQQPQSPFQGPQYLPPQRENTQSAYSAPEYLPPPQAANVAELPQQQQPQQQSYATPSAAAGVAQSDAYSAPDQLPPDYDFTNPEQQQQQPIQNALPLPAPQPEAIPRPTQSSGNLPPGYEFNRPENAEQAIAELHGLQLQQQQQQQEQPIEQQPVQQQPQPVSVQPQIQAPAIIYGHQTQPQSEQQLQQLAPTTAYVASSADSALQSGVAANQQAQSNYQSQQANVQQLVEYNGNNDQQQYSAPGHLPPTAAPAPAAPPATVASHIHSLSSYMTAVQPFERYGAARFNEPRKPFPEYGPPPGAAKYQPVQQYQQQQQQQQHYAPAMSYQTSNAEVFQQSFHGPQQQHQQQQHQFQPPAAPSAVAAAGVGYTFNAQTKQTLQRLMPKEIQLSNQNFHQQPQVHHQQQQQQQQQHQQHHIVASIAQAPAGAVAALPAAALPAAGKIRTLQIINPHAAVKTLKVLETSDHAGVKTIKILGASDASPIGQHRIVKVVSQSAHNAHESHVQTVKIFDEQEGGSAYLPPRQRRNARTSDKSSAKNKHRRHSKNSSAARGRQSRRY